LEDVILCYLVNLVIFGYFRYSVEIFFFLELGLYDMLYFILGFY
jgi:hypothetical protein